VTGLVGKQGLHGKVERFQQLSTRANKEMAALEPIHEELETDRLDSTRASTESEQGPVLLDSSSASSAKIKPIKAD
jgi:DNA recombination protein RmuC